MKEATGELNTTVVVVLAVGVLIAFFYYTIWPMIKDNFDKNSQCSKAICEGEPDSEGYITCHMKGKTEEFKCVYKG